MQAYYAAVQQLIKNSEAYFKRQLKVQSLYRYIAYSLQVNAASDVLGLCRKHRRVILEQIFQQPWSSSFSAENWHTCY